MSKIYMRRLFSVLYPVISAPILSVCFLLIALMVAAQTESVAGNIRVSASVSSTDVMIGERFELLVEVHSTDPLSVSRPHIPDLTGLRYLSSIPRTQTSYSQINGESQMVYRYNYTVEAANSGAYQIPPVYISIDGQEFRTDPVTVIVNASNSNAAQRRPASRSDRPDIFLELEIDETRPVRGQQIVTEIVLYFRNTIDVNTFHIVRSWQTEGFWKVDLNQSHTRRPESVILNGISYRRAVLARYSLFPTRSGELTVPPFSVRVSVRKSGQFRDDFSSFFDGFGRQRNVDLETSSRTLSISSPPSPPYDGQLISALGQFTIERTINNDQVVLGESVDVITKIKGSGNLGLITRPAYQYPDAFDMHQPQEIIERDETAPEMAGIKQFRDVLIPGSTGQFTVPESTILVFNDATRRYERHVLPALNLEVIRDPNTRVTIARGNDMRLIPVRGSVSWHQNLPAPYYYKWWFWFSMAIPGLLFILGYRSYRYKMKLAADEQFSRSEKAYRHSISRLNEAAGMQDVKPSYSAMHNALSGFITARLNLPSAGLSDEHIQNVLRERHVEAPLYRRVFRLLNKCATIRYAPDPSPGDRASDVAEIRSLLSELKLQL